MKENSYPQVKGCSFQEPEALETINHIQHRLERVHLKYDTYEHAH